MFKLGVIPAAGKAERWGGGLKELLPIGDRAWLIDRTISAMRMGGADAILLVTNKEKIHVHADHLDGLDIPIFYVVQQGDNDIYSAIEESFAIKADHYLFAMPDTLYPLDAFKRFSRESFNLGLHLTDKPERFGVFVDGLIVDKAELPQGHYEAWGVLSWSRDIVELWQMVHPENYTEAINRAIECHGRYTWKLDFYYDMASFEDYRDWMLKDEH